MHAIWMPYSAAPIAMAGGDPWLSYALDSATGRSFVQVDILSHFPIITLHERYYRIF